MQDGGLGKSKLGYVKKKCFSVFCLAYITSAIF